ncbi:MAG: hypothetical protein EOP48_31540 [Sphingobacteriales bacterium]|nr:MAG: hypothetical protein EOP48_31540 [Sphingobacteriales bacterium]
MTSKDEDRKWNDINKDLKDALETWTVLTEDLTNKLSPEEKQLQEIKTLLSTLKDKLRDFNDL